MLVAALYTVPMRPGEVLQWENPNLEHTSGPQSLLRPQNPDFWAQWSFAVSLRTSTWPKVCPFRHIRSASRVPRQGAQ